MRNEYAPRRRTHIRTMLRGENGPLLLSLAVLVVALIYAASLFILARGS